MKKLYLYLYPFDFLLASLLKKNQDKNKLSPNEKHFLQRLLDTLGTLAQTVQIARGTGRALQRYGGLATAMVTAQALMALVQGHARIATWTRREPTAVVTHPHRRESAAVDKNQALLLLRQSCAQGIDQGGRQSIVRGQLT